MFYLMLLSRRTALAHSRLFFEVVNIATYIDPSIKWSASAQPINVFSLVVATIQPRLQNAKQTEEGFARRL